jgi:hypothetical protein
MAGTNKPAANLILRREVESVGAVTGFYMPRDVLELRRALYCRIATHEALADQGTRKAETFERDGRYCEAEHLRHLVRSHRIRVMEVRAHIGLLEAVFGLGRE